jgi:hypothetical protein
VTFPSCQRTNPFHICPKYKKNIVNVIFILKSKMQDDVRKFRKFLFRNIYAKILIKSLKKNFFLKNYVYLFKKIFFMVVNPEPCTLSLSHNPSMF